jgi:hypothetical protein
VVDDVLGLEVAVDDLALVHVVQRAADLLHDHLGHLLGQLALLLQQRVELPRVAQFLHQVDVLLICEEGVEFHDVRVVQEGLDLDLSHQLDQQLRLHVALADPFQRAHEPRLLVLGHEDLAELARAELLAELEVGDGDGAGSVLLLLGGVGGGGGHGLAVG